MGSYTDWTYGAEHELADWDQRKGLPPGFKTDVRDTTMVNSNGIAVDPRGQVYPFGGEINTPPTLTPMAQSQCLETFLKMHPNAKVNYRSNLHIHVRVPGLSGDLVALKRLAAYNHAHLKELLPELEPIPEPRRENFPSEEQYEGARRRYRRRLRSHHTVLPAKRAEHQLRATTIDEFMEREVPRGAGGRPGWTLQPRCAVNVRQLRETDTIEFRHFPGTLDPAALLTCLEWCKRYLECALSPLPMHPQLMLRDEFAGRVWPQFPEYVHWMEQRYRRTIHDGTVPRAQIEECIDAWHPKLYWDQDPAEFLDFDSSEQWNRP